MYGKCSSCNALTAKTVEQVKCQDCCTRIMDPPQVYPDGPLGAELDLSADLDSLGCLYHDKPVKILHACFYPNKGAHLLHLGEQTQIGFTTDPENIDSDFFTFRFLKYPTIEGAQRDAEGRVTYQSRGKCIREGDNLRMDNVAIGKVLTHGGYISTYNTPFINVPYRDSIEDFAYNGTKSPENIRIISADFDPSVPLNEQPIVRMDGKKKYYIQFTRTSQFLSLVPGQNPAPCLIKISGYMGDNTGFVFIEPDFARTSRIESQNKALQQQQQVANAAGAAATPLTTASAPTTLSAADVTVGVPITV